MTPTALANTNGSRTQPFGFTGEQRDSENGLTYLRARMYGPDISRFLSRDRLAGELRSPNSLHHLPLLHIYARRLRL